MKSIRDKWSWIASGVFAVFMVSCAPLVEQSTPPPFVSEPTANVEEDPIEDTLTTTTPTIEDTAFKIIENHQADSLQTIIWSPDGEGIVLGLNRGDTYGVSFYNLESMSETWFAETGITYGLAFNFEGEELARLAPIGGVVQILDSKNGDRVQEFYDIQYCAGGNHISFGPSNELIITGNSVKDFPSPGLFTSSIYRWSRTNGECLGQIFESEGRVVDLEISSDGQLFAIGQGSLPDSEGFITFLIEFDSGMKVCEFDGAGASFDPTGKLIAVPNSEAGVVTSFDTAACESLRSLEVPGYIYSFSPDWDQLATVSGEGVITIYDFATNEKMGEFAWPFESTVRWLMFSPDGSYLLAASDGIGGSLPKIIYWLIEA